MSAWSISMIFSSSCCCCCCCCCGSEPPIRIGLRIPRVLVAVTKHILIESGHATGQPLACKSVAAAVVEAAAVRDKKIMSILSEARMAAYAPSTALNRVTQPLYDHALAPACPPRPLSRGQRPRMQIAAAVAASFLAIHPCAAAQLLMVVLLLLLLRHHIESGGDCRR